MYHSLVFYSPTKPITIGLSLTNEPNIYKVTTMPKIVKASSSNVALIYVG
jgi:hypothetical protein